jgi:hypothetical protein
MLAFLSLIPGLFSVINGFTSKYFDAKVAITQAKIGGDRDVAVKLVQAAAAQEHENTARLSIISSNKILTLLLVAMAIPIVGFEWKVIVWDKILGWGTTDPLAGEVASWAQSVIYFLFGAPTAMGLGKMWFSRKTS